MPSKLPAGWFYPADVCEYRRIYQDMVPAGGHTAELGVYRGRSLASVADLIIEKHITVTAVDNFKPSLPDPATDRFENFIDAMRECGLLDCMWIVKGNSSLPNREPEKSLDFVFIDADHEYAAVSADIAAWLPTIKPGGYLGGHDYWEPGVHEAVARANFTNLVVRNPQSSIWLTRIGESLQ